MKYFSLCILLISTISSIAQTTFKKSIPIGVQNEVGYDVIETDDKGFLIAGFNTVIKDTIWRTCLVKLDSTGNFIAKYDLGTGIISGAYRIRKTLDGGYVLAGFDLEPFLEEYHIYVIKVDSNLKLEYEKQLPAVLGSIDNWSLNPAVDIWQKPDGKYIICGSDGVNTNEKKGFIAELDLTLNISWFSYIEDPDFTFSIHALSPTPDGGFVFTGFARMKIGSNNNAFLLKIDENGFQEWLKIIGDSFWNKFTNAVLVEANGYILAGKKYSLCCGKDGGTWQSMLMKTDLSGNFLWEKVYPYIDGGINDDWDDIFDLERAYDGGYLLAGYLGGDANNKEFAIIKTDTSGNELWKKIYGYPSEEVCFSFSKTSDSGIVMTGYNTFGADWNLFVVKTKDAPAELCPDRPVVSCFSDTVMNGDTISFTAVVTGGAPPYSYYWTGPGGFASLEPNPVFVYPEPRTFYFGLYVTDANDCIGICENYAIVVDPCDSSGFPVVFAASDTVLVSDTTSFISSVQGNAPPFNYFWSGLGGLEDSIPEPKHVYPQAGIYYYQLMVTDTNNCLTRFEGYVLISDTCTNKPIVTTSADTVLVKKFGKNIYPTHFTSTVQGGTPPYYYTWYGDNNFRDTVANPENVYFWEGKYFYGLTVRDNQNCFGYSTGIAEIMNKCDYYGSPVAVCETDTVLQGEFAYLKLKVDGGSPPYRYMAYDDFGNFSDSLKPVFYYPFPGVYTYYFWVNDTAICFDECEGYTVVLDTLSISKGEESHDYETVKIYPNPVSEKFSIVINGKTQGKMTFEITNSLGKVVYSKDFDFYKSEETLTMKLPAGIYFYHLRSKDGGSIVYRGKMVKL